MNLSIFFLMIILFIIFFVMKVARDIRLEGREEERGESEYNLLRNRGYTVSLGAHIGDILPIADRIEILEREIKRHQQGNPKLSSGGRHMLDTGVLVAHLSLGNRQNYHTAGEVSIWVSPRGIIHTHTCPTTGPDDIVT